MIFTLSLANHSAFNELLIPDYRIHACEVDLSFDNEGLVKYSKY